jgi:hypothetical protein
VIKSVGNAVCAAKGFLGDPETLRNGTDGICGAATIDLRRRRKQKDFAFPK